MVKKSGLGRGFDSLIPQNFDKSLIHDDLEKVQRVDLCPLEQGGSIVRLHEQFSMTFEMISERLGKATSTINNIVRLLQLPENARKALEDNKITEGHARAILALKDSLEKQT